MVDFTMLSVSHICFKSVFSNSRFCYVLALRKCYNVTFVVAMSGKFNLHSCLLCLVFVSLCERKSWGV